MAYVLGTDSKAGSQKPSIRGDKARHMSNPGKVATEIAVELESILAGLGTGPGSTLLEAGSGSGHISLHLASRGYETTLLGFGKAAMANPQNLFKQNGVKGSFVHHALSEISPEKVGRHDIVWNMGVLERLDGLQAMDAMKKMASVAEKFVIIVMPIQQSQSYMDSRRKAIKEGSWKKGSEILREDMRDLALLSGLEMVEEHLVGPACNADSPKAGTPANDSKHFKVVVTKPAGPKLAAGQDPNPPAETLRKEMEALRRTYRNDMDSMASAIKSLGNMSDQMRADLDSERRRTSGLERSNSKLRRTIEDQKKEHLELDEYSHFLWKSLEYERQRMDALLDTKTWKLTKMYERKFQGNLAGRLIEKMVGLVLRDNVQQAGSQQPALAGSEEHAGDAGEQAEAQKKDELDSILELHPDIKGVVVYPPGIDWNIPLLQRPQHMARCLAANGWLYFYCTMNAYDKISGYKQLSENLYLTDKFDRLVERLDSFFLFVHSAHPTLTMWEIKQLEKKADLVYDYLDEIHPDVSGLKPRDVLERHHYMMKNSKAVVATARNLLSNVSEVRGTGAYLLPNAVDYDHFHISRDSAAPHDMRAVVKSGGPILGYFGAIAKWFDYSLVKEVARANPEWNIVLIGWDYDDSIKHSGIDAHPNIHYLGIKDYSMLPRYAAWFDVCILPFLLSNVTHSTSPIKLFEYMALGKPIVATPLREVKNYQSPLVASGPGEFEEKIKKALLLRDDKKYLDLLDSEARDNTWEKRFAELDGIMQSIRAHDKTR